MSALLFSSGGFRLEVGGGLVVNERLAGYLVKECLHSSALDFIDVCHMKRAGILGP